MARHELPATHDTVVNFFDRDTPPVLTVDAGDSVRVGSLDAAGCLEPMRTPGDPGPRMFEDRTGHCLTGPIAVRGAEPGMVLEVRFDSVTTGTWGWTLAGVKDSPLTRRLGVADGPAGMAAVGHRRRNSHRRPRPHRVHRTFSGCGRCPSRRTRPAFHHPAAYRERGEHRLP